MKYMIHAVPKRMWYVTEHLIPSMQDNGIKRSDILVYCDKAKAGNLIAFTASIREVREDVWHLQDDVIISRRFKPVTEAVSGLVCGFCSSYCEGRPSGLVSVENMWYSFPCIRIPAQYSKEFLEWLDKEALNVPLYRYWIESGKYDDSLFMEFMTEKHKDEKVLNLKPNIVNHIDYMIGGSIVNKIRSRDAKSVYWEEPELLQYWKERLHGAVKS